MSIDEQAQADLTLGGEEAEGVIGGKKKTTRAAKPAARSFPVEYIKVPGSAGAVPEAAPAGDDCADDPYASDPPTH